MKKNRERNNGLTRLSELPGQPSVGAALTQTPSQTRGVSIEQARTGYRNAQETIRFLDTKTTYLTSASTLTIGFILQAIKQYLQLPDNLRSHFEIHPYMLFVLEVLAALSLLGGALCLWCCIISLVGRPPANSSVFRHTVLFPFYEGNIKERQCCAKIVRGMLDEDIAQEYECQVWTVGLILRRKLIRHRWAAFMFLAQLISLVVGGIVVVFCNC
jgi:hypothetical protein